MANVINSINNLIKEGKYIPSNERLAQVLAYVTETYASSRTARYVLASKEVDFVDTLTKVCETIVALQSSKGTFVDVETSATGIYDTFGTKEYKVPSALVGFINSGVIYGSHDAVDKMDPIFEVPKVACPLTPMRFNKFFLDYNANQIEGQKIPCTEGLDKTRDRSLTDLQYLSSNGRMCRWMENGLDAETCYLLDIQIPELTKYLGKYDGPSFEGMARWLLNG